MNSKKKISNMFLVIGKYFGTGFLIGLFFPLVAYIIELKNYGLTMSVSSIQFIHIRNDLLFIIDIAPICLGIFSGAIGFITLNSNKINKKLNAVDSDNRKIIDKINVISPILSDNTKEIDESIQVINQNEKELMNLSGSTVNAVDKLKTEIDNIKKNSDLASTQASSNLTYAEEGKEVIADMFKSINKSKELINTNNNEINSLAEEVKNIMITSKVISEIAEHTNLLALNAAIESARAGEAGRGFQVVAEEVRDLAEKTANATSEIESKIVKIQGDTTRIVNRIVETANSSEESSALIADTEQRFSQMIENINKTKDIVGNISNITDEQSANVQNISNYSNNVMKIMDQMNVSLEKGNHSVSKNREAAEELSDIIGGGTQ